MSITSLIPKPARQAARNALNNLITQPCREEYDRQAFVKFNERRGFWTRCRRLVRLANILAARQAKYRPQDKIW